MDVQRATGAEHSGTRSSMDSKVGQQVGQQVVPTARSGRRIYEGALQGYRAVYLAASGHAALPQTAV